MIDIRFENRTINVEALDNTLRESLTDTLIGVNFDGTDAIIHLQETATEAEITLVQTIVDAHDPARLSDQQQRRQARRDRLDDDRVANETPLTLEDFNGQNPLIRQIARKLVWIEREIRELRDF